MQTTLHLLPTLMLRLLWLWQSSLNSPQHWQNLKRQTP
jgi:hypothetical protein